MFLVDLSAAELPEGLSANVVKAQKNYQDDLADSRTDLEKEINKRKAKFVKAYKKLEKSMFNKGQVKGIKLVQQRLKQLEQGNEGDLFGGENKSALSVDDLPEGAQALEQNYDNDIASLLAEQQEVALSALADFTKAMQGECKRLMKKRLIDQAEDLQEFIDAMQEPQVDSKLASIAAMAACLNTPVLSVDPNLKWTGEPASRNDLLFIWEHAKAANVIVDKKGRALMQCVLTQRDDGKINEQGILEVKKGAFLAEQCNQAILHACKQSGELSVQAIINPAHDNQRGPARIISFSQNGSLRNFSLCQEGANLRFRLRTPLTDTNGCSPEVQMGDIPIGKESHVLVTYKNGQLEWWINGQHGKTDAVKGDFSNWDAQHLVLGDEYQDSRYWAGTMRGVRIHARASNAEQAETAYKRFLRSSK